MQSIINVVSSRHVLVTVFMVMKREKFSLDNPTSGVSLK